MPTKLRLKFSPRSAQGRTYCWCTPTSRGSSVVLLDDATSVCGVGARTLIHTNKKFDMLNAKNCIVCHGIDEEATPLGNAMTHFDIVTVSADPLNEQSPFSEMAGVSCISTRPILVVLQFLFELLYFRTKTMTWSIFPLSACTVASPSVSHRIGTLSSDLWSVRYKLPIIDRVRRR